MEIEEATGKTPDALLSKPEITFELKDYHHAFTLLNRRRNVHENESISLSDFHYYCVTFGIDEEEREFFFKVIEICDYYLMSFLKEFRALKAEFANEN